MTRPLVSLGDQLELRPGDYLTGTVGDYYSPPYPMRATVVELPDDPADWERDWLPLVGEQPSGRRVRLTVNRKVLPGYAPPVRVW